MNLEKGKEAAKEFLGKIAVALKALVEPASGLRALFAEKIAPPVSRLYRQIAALLTARFGSIFPASGKKTRQPIIVGGIAGFLLILIIVAIATSVGGREANIPLAAQSIHAIAPEELFIPDEPNFLPDFLLEREPRHFWSVDDIRPYWRTPGAQDFWQGIIRSTVEELMENVR